MAINRFNLGESLFTNQPLVNAPIQKQEPLFIKSEPSPAFRAVANSPGVKFITGDLKGAAKDIGGQLDKMFGSAQGVLEHGADFTSPLGAGGFVKSVAPKVAPKVFSGLKNLSTKLLEKFRGMAEEITPQQFNEVLNRATKEGTRQADRDLVVGLVDNQKYVNTKEILKDLPKVMKGEADIMGKQEFQMAVDKLISRYPNEKLVYSDIPANLIKPTSIRFDPRDQARVLESIKKGDKTPLVVEFRDGKYVLIDGHHRLRAYQELGIKDVSVIVQEKGFIKPSGKINLTKLAKDVETQLVPLTPTPVKSPRWSNVGQDFIGDGKYGEIVYQSPIKTSAGYVHFQARGLHTFPDQQIYPNYFSHVRYEDM